MIVKLLTEHHLEFLSLKGGCRGLSESTLVKISNCWKSHAPAQLIREDIIISLIQHFEADFPQKVSLKILKTFTHGYIG